MNKRFYIAAAWTEREERDQSINQRILSLRSTPA